MTDQFDDEVLSRLEISRRELVRRLVVGTAFAVPVIASFDMASLTTTSADALTSNLATFTSPASTTFTVGQPGSFDVIATDISPPSPTITESGSLPTGVLFHSGQGTATLSGTPASGTGGVYPLTFTASDGAGGASPYPPGKQTFTLTVDEAPAITSPASASFPVGQPGSFTIATSGYPTSSLMVSGSLPAGVTFTDNGDGTASLSGTPAASAPGVHQLTITATNGVGSGAVQQFTLTVGGLAPAITSAAAATFTAGQPSSFTVTTTGDPTASITEQGTLPPGVSFSDNRDGTATLSGTPATGSAGAYGLTLTAANGATPDASQAFTLTVHAGPLVAIVTPASGATYTVGQRVNASYSAQDAKGGPGLASITGTVADGRPIDTSKAGSKTFTVTAVSKDGLTTTETVAYTVALPSNEFTVSNVKGHADGTFTFDAAVPGAGTIDVMLTAWNDNVAVAAALQPAAKRFVVGRAQATARGAGKLHVRVRPNAKGKQLVQHHRYEVTLRLWITYTPTYGRARDVNFDGLHLPKP